MSAGSVLCLLLLTEVLGQEHGDVRLIGGAVVSEGTVEVYSAAIGGWGTVCDRDWNYNDGVVVCTQLGYNDSELKTYSGAHFGAGSGSVIPDLQGLDCSGTESNLFECPNNKPLIACGHDRDAGVKCLSSDKANGDNVALTVALIVPFAIIILIILIIIIVFIILTIRYDKDAASKEEMRIKEKRFIKGVSLKEQRKAGYKKGLFRRKSGSSSSTAFTIPREALGEGTPHPWQVADEVETDVDETQSHFKYEMELRERDETVGAINPVLIDKLKQEENEGKNEKIKTPKKYKKQKAMKRDSDSSLDSDGDSITPYELSTSFSFSS